MNNFPAIKFAIFFICGILIADHLHLGLIWLISALSLTIILLILTIIFTNGFITKVTSFISLLLVVVCGYVTALGSKDYTQLLPPDLYKEKHVTLYGQINRINLIREYELSFETSSDSLKLQEELLIGEYKFLCRIRDERDKLDSLYNIILPGNKVIIKGTYQKGRDQRNPGEFDFNLYLNSRNISGLFTAYTVEAIEIISEDKSPLKAGIFSVRKSIDDKLHSLLRPEAAGLLRGLLLADRSEISYQTKTEFINSGVIHILAVSGLHVGFIALIFFIVFGRFNLYIRSIATAAGLLFFMVITEMPPSVFRASVMAVIIITAFLSGRTTYIFNSLSIAALIILIVNPSEIYNPGFQLSFSAVAAIGSLYPYFEKRINQLKIRSIFLRNILLFTALSFSAQVGTLPFTLLYFGKLSVVALLINLLVIPTAGIIVSLGLFTIILSYIWTGLAAFYGLTINLLVSFLFALVSFAGGREFSYLRIRQFTLQDAILFYVFMLFFCYYFVRFKSVTGKFLLTVLTFITFILYASFDDREFFVKNELNVLAVDVGQGDAILIRFPDGTTGLIDAGNATPFIDNGERVLLPLLDHLNIKKIDYAFISHLDADHYGGFVSLVYHNKINHIIKPALDTSLAKDVRLENYLDKMDVSYSYYENGFIDVGNVRIYILNDESDGIYRNLSTNDKSGLKKICYGNTTFLFTGDIERKAEEYYARRYGEFLKADVLKVAHHGSRTSTNPAFIRHVRPEISIISAGIQNQFGHPSEIVLERLRQYSYDIYRTDESGALHLVSDGEKIFLKEWREYE